MGRAVPALAIRCLLVIAALLTSCGGGAPAAQQMTQQVTVVGDSLTSNGSLAVTTVQRMRQQLGARYVISDHSWPGRGASLALNGEPDGVPFTNFAALVQSEHPQVAVILYGGAEVIGRADPVQFEADMRALVSQAHAVGASVVLATIIHHPVYELQEAPFNDSIRRVAADTNSALADAYALTPGGFTDGIHPDQEWSDRRAALIAGVTLSASGAAR